MLIELFCPLHCLVNSTLWFPQLSKLISFQVHQLLVPPTCFGPPHMCAVCVNFKDRGGGCLFSEDLFSVRKYDIFFFTFSPAASLWHLTFLNSRSDLSNGWEAWPWRRSIPHPTHVMCIQLLFKWRSDDKLSNCHRVSMITSEEGKRKSKWTRMCYSEAISSISYSTYLLNCQSICVAACCILILCHISHHIILSLLNR